MVNDPVADMITRLKNAGAVGKTEVVVPYSKLAFAIAEKLKASGYLTDVVKKQKKGRVVLALQLTYGQSGTPKITHTERLSKPGRRLYAGAHAIHPVRGGQGAVIVSTPRGVLTGDEARKEHVGGELLFEVW